MTYLIALNKHLIEFTDIKRDSTMNPLWCMVGRERFERSTIGLWV